MTARPSARVGLAFCIVVVTLGTNWVATRISNEELAPFWGAAVRFAAACLLLWWIVALARIPLPKGSSLAGSMIYGALVFGANFGLLYYALVEVPAGTASVVFAFVPLATFLLAIAHRIEAFRVRGLTGALLAAGGVSLVFWQQAAADVPWIRLAAVLVAVVLVSEATILIKRFPKAHPVSSTAVAMATGTTLLIALSLAAGEPRALPSTGRVWAALAWLIPGGSVLGFVMVIYVINHWTASASSYATVLAPLITVAVAAVWTAERLSPAFALGGSLVLLGVWVGALSRRGKPGPVQAGTGPEAAPATVPPQP